jgi:hypothetical protein
MTMLTAIPRPATARPPIYAHGVARSQLAGVLTLGLAILVGQILAAPAVPILEPDSGGYLTFASFRPSGYPLLLWLVGAQGALAVQPTLAAFTLTYLGCELLALTRSALLAGVTMLAVALNPFLLVYHYKIMSDSLYVSLLMLLLGLLVHLVRKPSLGFFATASVVAGAIITVRSVGCFVVPLMVLVPLTLRSKVHSRALFVAAALIPMLIIAVTETGLRGAAHNGSMNSLFGTALYGKAGMIDAPPLAGPSRAAVALEKTLAPIRELIAASPSAAITRYLTVNYEACIQYSCSVVLGIDPASPAALQAARARIGANPFGYLRLAWRHYVALWSPYGASTPSDYEAANDFLDSNRPLPFEEQTPVFNKSLKPARLSLVAEPAMFIVALLTGVLALAGIATAILRQVLPPVLMVAVIAALAVQSAFVLTALEGVGVPRYTLAMWPAMMVALAGWGWSLLIWLGANLPLLQRAPQTARKKIVKRARSKPAHLSQQKPVRPPELVDPAQLKPAPFKGTSAPVVKPTSKPAKIQIEVEAAKEPAPTKDANPAKDADTVVAPEPTKKAQPVKVAEPTKEAETAKDKEPAAEAK